MTHAFFCMYVMFQNNLCFKKKLRKGKKTRNQVPSRAGKAVLQGSSKSAVGYTSEKLTYGKEHFENTGGLGLSLLMPQRPKAFLVKTPVSSFTKVQPLRFGF